VIALLVALLGCTEPAPQCVDNGQCALGEACLAEVCVAVECLDSSTCGLEQYCEKPSYTCEDGCEANSDCLAGQRCNQEEHECFEYGCRETDLDCAFGEICDEDSGECKPAGGKHCASCVSLGDCGSNAECYLFGEEDAYCIVNCTEGDSCPRGYECVELNDLGDWGCLAWCPVIVGE